jgi:hypothetical protein
LGRVGKAEKVILLQDADLVATGFQVELHEDFRSLDSVHHFVDAWKWVTILDHDVVELAIVNDQSVGSILFPYEEHWCGDWAIQISRFGPPCAQHLIEYLMALSMFLLIHVIQLAGLWKGLFGVKVDCKVDVSVMKSLSGSRARKFRSIPMLCGISGWVLRLVRTLSDQNSPIHRGKGKWE